MILSWCARSMSSSKGTQNWKVKWNVSFVDWLSSMETLWLWPASHLPDKSSDHLLNKTRKTVETFIIRPGIIFPAPAVLQINSNTLRPSKITSLWVSGSCCSWAQKLFQFQPCCWFRPSVILSRLNYTYSWADVNLNPDIHVGQRWCLMTSVILVSLSFSAKLLQTTKKWANNAVFRKLAFRPEVCTIGCPKTLERANSCLNFKVTYRSLRKISMFHSTSYTSANSPQRCVKLN